MMRGASADALNELTSSLKGTQDVLATLGEQLCGAAGVLRSEVALRRVATDASIEGDAKAGLIANVFGSALDAPALALVSDAVRRRWTLGGDLPAALEQLGITALVRSAGAQGNQVGDELFAVGQLVEGNDDLRTVLSDPSRSTADRGALLTGLLEGSTLPATRTLVAQAISGNQGSFSAVLASYQKIAATAQDEMVAVVTSARDLSTADVDRLAGALGKQYSTTVHLHVVVDPSLVGGLRVEIGDDVIDGSVSSRLDEARRLLAG